MSLLKIQFGAIRAGRSACRLADLTRLDAHSDDAGRRLREGNNVLPVQGSCTGRGRGVSLLAKDVFSRHDNIENSSIARDASGARSG
jgi:hypothetical protein